MSSQTLAANLTSYAFQVALLLGVGLLLPLLLHPGPPRACLRYWQGLLLAILLLPALQLGVGPAEPAAAFSGWIEAVAAPGAEGSGSFPLHQAVLLLLAAGALIRLVWLLLGFRALRLWRRDARPAVLDPAVEEVFREVGVRARILVSDDVPGPVTFGWRDPAVLLPSSFFDLSPRAQRGIACHELLHVRRRDWLFALFEEGVRALLWFHPAVWALLSRIALTREQVVDGETVRITGARRSYLEALRSIACIDRRAAIPGLPFLNRSHLFQRVAQLTQEVTMSRTRVATLMTTFAGALAVTAVLGVSSFPMAGIASAAPGAAGRIARVEGDVVPPRAIETSPPVYPESARKDKIEGTAQIETVIDENGDVTEPKVVKSSGNGDLDQAALDSVSRWKFKPATQDGEPIKVYYTLTIRFTLDENGSK